MATRSSPRGKGKQVTLLTSKSSRQNVGKKADIREKTVRDRQFTAVKEGGLTAEKRKRGRPPKNAGQERVDEEESPSGASKQANASDDVVVTGTTVRRSSRSRVVKSARELLGLAPEDKIKKEEDLETSTDKSNLKFVARKVPKYQPAETVVLKKVHETPEVTISSNVTIDDQPVEDEGDNNSILQCESIPQIAESAEDHSNTCDVIESESDNVEIPFEGKKEDDCEEYAEEKTIATESEKTCNENEESLPMVTDSSDKDATEAEQVVIQQAPDGSLTFLSIQENMESAGPVVTTTAADTHVETVTYADAAEASIYHVKQDFVIPEPSKTQFSIKKGADSQNIQVVKTTNRDQETEIGSQGPQLLEVQIIGEDGTECFDGLVDPETGHIIMPGQEDQHPVSSKEEVTRGSKLVSSSTPYTVREILGSKKGMTQYVIYNSNENSLSFENVSDAKDDSDLEPPPKKVRSGENDQQEVGQATEVLINLQHNELSLVGSEEEEEQVIDALQKIHASQQSPTQHTTDNLAEMQSVPISCVTSMSTSKFTKTKPSKKNQFNGTAMTSDDLATAPRNRNGRCRPQKHVVVAPELQDLVDGLKENDVMENHIVRVGEKEGYRNRFACKYCGDDIYNRHQFRRHINTHHKDVEYKPWKCPLCDYSAIIKAAIARHINIHSDLKPYTCSKCGKGFTFRQKLQIHMKYHEDVRDHKCALCDMAFHELKTLKTHLLKIHGIEKSKEFIDKYRGQQLTSVLVQLDSGTEPTQGYILPKGIGVDKEGRKIPVVASRKPTGLRIADHSKKELFPPGAKGDMIVQVEKRTLEKVNDLQTSVFLTRPDGETAVVTVAQPSEDSPGTPFVIEPELITRQEGDEDEASQQAEDSIDLHMEVHVTPGDDNVEEQDMEGQDMESKEEQAVEATDESNADSQLIVVPETDISVVVEDSQSAPEEEEEQLHTQEENGEQQAVSPSTNENEKLVPMVMAGEADEVSVLLPRYKKSTLYGTRKTLLRTSRYKLGLEASNYTPIKSPKSKSYPETVTSDPRTGRDVKVVNNQKIVSEFQLEDELKKYCRIDTSSDVSRIIFTCTVCPASLEDPSSNQFYSKTQFCSHLEVEHPDIKPWLCETCGFKCRMRTSLLAHDKTHDVNKKHECHICGRKFLFKQKLTVHMRSHANLRNHACGVCKKRFNERSDVTRHIQRVHGPVALSSGKQDFHCDVCDKTIHDAQTFESHMETHDPSKKYVCPYCKRLYRSKGSLAQHMKSHTCMFHCEICNKNFGSYSGFMAHKVMHDQSYEGFECDVCKKRLHTKGSYTRHKLVAHSDIRPFQCDQCTKGFKTKKDLKNHAYVHTTVRAFACSVCNFSCKRMESLKIHMRRHSEVKPYQCGLCGKEYTQKNSLESHLRHHTGALAGFTCLICASEFSSKYLLKKHMVQAHPDAMDVGEPMVDSLSLEATAAEHGVTVFMCEECNSVFLSQDDLAVHILAEHMKQGFAGNTGSATVTEKGLNDSADHEGIRVKTDLDDTTSLTSTEVDKSLGHELMVNSDVGVEDMVEYVTISSPGRGGQRVVTLLHPTTTHSLLTSPIQTQPQSTLEVEVEVGGEQEDLVMKHEEVLLPDAQMQQHHHITETLDHT